MVVVLPTPRTILGHVEPLHGSRASDGPSKDAKDGWRIRGCPKGGQGVVLLFRVTRGESGVSSRFKTVHESWLYDIYEEQARIE